MGFNETTELRVVARVAAGPASVQLRLDLSDGTSSTSKDPAAVTVGAEWTEAVVDYAGRWEHWEGGGVVDREAVFAVQLFVDPAAGWSGAPGGSTRAEPLHVFRYEVGPRCRRAD
jgi:hypothetical protein